MKILLIEVGYRIFFKKNILAAPQICELYHIKLENNKKLIFVISHQQTVKKPK